MGLWIIIAVLRPLSMASFVLAWTKAIDFNKEERGSSPKGFGTALTGKIGLWVKADSYTWFDNHAATILD